LAAAAAFILPRVIGEPNSLMWLLLFRLFIVAVVCIPCALLIAVSGGSIESRFSGHSGWLDRWHPSWQHRHRMPIGEV
jgi:hypothetical protein